MANKKLEELSKPIDELGQVVCGHGYFKERVGELFEEDLERNLENRQGNKDES